MTPENTNGTEREDRLNAILASWLEAAESGQALDEREFIARYPEFAPELSRHIATWKHFAPFRSPDNRGGDTPHSPSATPRSANDTSPSPGAETLSPVGEARFFADYELLEEIGRGGMGVVFKARQKGPNRLVALKMVRGDRFMSDEDVQRFRNEAELVAQLDHPNLVPIYEVGQWPAGDGNSPVFYFTMKLIEGGSLSKLIASGFPGTGSCGQLPLTRREFQRNAAQLLVPIAEAIHQAHQRGILHRDLKPSNILLDVEGRPHVSDFGLAKRVTLFADYPPDASLTETGAIVGTPQYMSPEQADGKQGTITTATDVYGLGAILYALLTGRPPFQEATPLETLVRVKDREPDRPTAINPRVDRDLETICLKCLEKEPVKRYGSAQAVAEELQRWLADKPIQARPMTRPARLWRWCRRNPKVAVPTILSLFLLAVVLGGLLVSTVLIMGQRDQARTHQALAENREATLRRHVYVADVHQAHQEWENGNLERMREILQRYIPRQGEEDLRTFAWFYLWRLGHIQPLIRTLSGQGKEIFSATFSPDGKELATAGKDGTVRLTDTISGHERLRIPVSPGLDVNSVVFSPDGQTLATASDLGSVRLWDRTTGQQIARLRAHKGDALAVAFSPDGQTLATGGEDRVIRLWDLQTRQVVGVCSLQMALPKEYGVLPLPWGRVGSLAFSPDGKILASSNFEHCTILWDVERRGVAFMFPTSRSYCTTMSHDGILVAYAGGEDVIFLIDRVSRRKVANWSLPWGGGIRSLAFSPDDLTLAAAGQDGTIRFWDVSTRKMRNAIHAHQGRISCLSYSPDGSTLVSASQDGTARVWDLRAGLPRRPRSPPCPEYVPIAISPDCRTVVLRMERTGKTLRNWDLSSGNLGEPMTGHRGTVGAAAFSTDGRRLCSYDDATARIWDARTGQLLGASFEHEGSFIKTVAISPDGTWLATGVHDKRICLWDLTQWRQHSVLLQGGSVEALTFSPDGKFLASGATSHVTRVPRTLRVWERETGEIKLNQKKPTGVRIEQLAYSPDGRFLAVGDRDGSLELWDLIDGEKLYDFQGNPGGVGALAFSPDCTTLASGGQDVVRLWDVATGRELISIPRPPASRCTCLRFTPDGLALVNAESTPDDRGEVTIWSAECTGIPMPTP
jgi:WD40 repeat protein/serine/threonine protein kinase